MIILVLGQKTENTATVPASVLSTSNGQNGGGRAHMGSTSRGSGSEAARAVVVPGVLTAFAGALALLVTLQR